MCDSTPRAKDRLWKVEVYLIYLFVLGVAAGGLSGFFGHVFTPDTVAESIDWPKGNPFQQEMGFANLALGVLGFIAAGRRDGFREATVIAIAIVGVGATVVHVIDMVQEGNLAPGNSIQNIGNLLKPALLIPLLIVSRRSESDEAASPSFDRWRKPVVGTAGMVTAVVGTGFGIGFSLEFAVPVTLDRSCPGGGHRGAVGEHPEDLDGPCSASGRVSALPFNAISGDVRLRANRRASRSRRDRARTCRSRAEAARIPRRLDARAAPTP